MGQSLTRKSSSIDQQQTAKLQTSGPVYADVNTLPGRTKPPARDDRVQYSDILPQPMVTALSYADVNTLPGRTKPPARDDGVQYSEILPQPMVTAPTLPSLLAKGYVTSNPPSSKRCSLDLENLFTELYPMNSKWQTFGEMLGMDEYLLIEIFTNNERDEECLRDILRMWLEKENPTWRAVTDALSKIGEDKLAESLYLKWSASKKARRARVTYSYAAENPDELSIQPGQIVEEVEEEEEGWLKGRVDGKEGLFPSNFVEMLPVEEDGKGRTAKQILEEALEKGYVLCSIIKVLTLGAAGSGKTCTKFRLLRENPPKTRCSTPLTEAAIRAISRVLIGTDLTGWFRVSYEELMSMLAKALKAGVPMEAKEQYEAMRVGIQHLQETLQRSQKVKKASSASIQPTPSSEELVRLVERSSGSKRFFEIQWINFIDSGGQPQFHELLPAFIRNANVIMFVLKLSECLDEQPIIEYYEQGQRCGDAQPCILRNDQILQHCIRTMHSRPSPSKEIQCRVIMVGTHRDLESQCTETRAEKNEKILRMFEPDFCDELVFYRPFTEVIFPLNAKEPTEKDHQVFSTICEQISDKKFAPEPSKVPIGWFLLEQDIRKLAAELGRGVLSMEECLDLATRLKINNEALKAALNYLDELNILLYYPSLLPNLLFAEPQALVDKSSELVAFNYKLRCKQISEAFTGEWKRFRDEGVVTLRMLEDERFSCHYVPKLFTPSDLIKLFRGLLIFAPLTTDEYFMPSLLPMIPAEEVKRYCPPPSSTVAPLLVHFPNRCAPNGIYCALVVHLLSVCGWELLYEAGTSRSPACVSRNCICFRLPGKPATVSLIDSFSFFEVHVKTPSTKILCQVRESVFAGLENASRALKYNDLKPIVAFLCECGTPPHSATTYIDGEDRYLVCTRTSEYGPLCRKHAVWLEEQPSSTPSADRPLLREMILFPGKATNFSIPQRIGTKFMQFGILLLNDDMGQRVESIALKHRSDCEQVNLEILKEWLKGAGQPVSWRTLVGVLRDIGHETLARDIGAVKC